MDSDNEEEYTHFNTLSQLASSHYSLIAFQHLHNSRVFTQDGITSHVSNNKFSWRIFPEGTTISFPDDEFPTSAVFQLHTSHSTPATESGN